MSLPALASLQGPTRDTLACSLALLILSEGSGSVCAADLLKVTEAAGVHTHCKTAEAFERGLQGKSVKSFLSVGGGGSQAAPAPAASAPAKGAPAKEEKKRIFL